MTQHYWIRVKGQLDPSWSAWFDDLTVTHETSGETVLAGPLPDQAALYGILEKARNLNLALVSVSQEPCTSLDDNQPTVREQHGMTP